MPDQEKNVIDFPRKIEAGKGVTAEIHEPSAEEEVETRAKKETIEYQENRYAGFKALLSTEKVGVLLEKSQTWPENWDKDPQAKEGIIKDTIEALGLEDHSEEIQGILVKAAVEALKKFKVVSRMTPPRAVEFLNQIESNLEIAKIQDIENWKSWYSKGEGAQRWEQIVGEVESRRKAA